MVNISLCTVVSITWLTYLMLDGLSYYYVYSLGYLISQYDFITDMAKDSCNTLTAHCAVITSSVGKLMAPPP